MPLSCCSNIVVFTALIATILLVPVQYYGEDYSTSEETLPEPHTLLREPFKRNVTQAWLSFGIPSIDLFFTVLLALMAMIIYLCDWIQRKLMEMRIKKLHRYLNDGLDRVKSWDVRQEQLETAIMLVQNATSEYNLLLHILLRHIHNKQINGLI